MTTESRAPVIVVGFNRPETIRRTFENLSRCYDAKQHDVYLYVDGERSSVDVAEVDSVCEVGYTFADSFKSLQVIRRPKNFGCRENIYQAVSEVLLRHGKMILVEDDVLVSRTFLQFMDDALEFYRDDKRIWNVNAYCPRYVKVPKSYPYDVFLNRRNWTPGWGTWLDRWNHVDFDLKGWDDFVGNPPNVERVRRAGHELVSMITKQAHAPSSLNAWDIQCSFHMIKNGLFSITPRMTLTKNIGFGMKSEHCGASNPTMPTQRYYNFRPQLVKNIKEDERVDCQFRYAGCDPRILSRIFRKLQRIVWGLGPNYDTPIDIR